MPNRPRIPAEVERQVLVESGHRCAVCGTATPLERAHIIPWHKSKEHKFEDLICLCANCHERADKEKWGAEALRIYKQRPWILRTEQPERAEDAFLVRVEKIAGVLSESLSGGWLRGTPKEEAFAMLKELFTLRGQLRRDKELLQALRDFENTVGWLLSNDGVFDSVEERRETLQELEERYQTVIKHVNAVR